MPAPAPAFPSPQQVFAPLLVKAGVGLGGLPDAQRQAALSMAATALPPDAVLNEAQVNQALRTFLAEAGRFLDIDHVELRRWLVDTGWWQRDGFGRAYQRVPVQHLAADAAALHGVLNEALQGQGLAAWAAHLRAAEQARRDARRAAWRAQCGPGTQEAVR